MARQIINIGTTPNDGTGDTVRNAFDKVNDNFDEVYNDLFVPLAGTDTGAPITGEVVFDASNGITFSDNATDITRVNAFGFSMEHENDTSVLNIFEISRVFGNSGSTIKQRYTYGDGQQVFNFPVLGSTDNFQVNWPAKSGTVAMTSDINAGTVTSVDLTTGTSGTDINVSGSPITSSGSITLNIPTASATNRGALSSADWTTFNNKLSAAVTSLNGLTASTQTFAIGSTGTDFNISSSTSTHTFNIPTASATNRGLLSSADWTTFNNKQNALTNPVTGTGVSGQVAFWSGTTAQSGSNNLFWDNTNGRLGIGTITPVTSLHIVGNAIRCQNVLADTTSKVFDIVSGHYNNSQPPFSMMFAVSNPSQNILWIGGGNSSYNSSTDIRFFTATNYTTLTGTERMRINSTGNLLINTTTDAGFRLDVNGTARVQGQLTTAISGSGTVLDVFTNGVAYNPLTITNSGSTFRSNGTNASLIANDFSVSSSGVGIRGRRASHLFNINKSSGNDSFGIYDGGTGVPDFLIKNNGNVLVGTSTDVASSILTIESTTKGFLPPRMTTTERNAIAASAAGLVIYNTTDNKHQGYDGTNWNNFY